MGAGDSAAPSPPQAVQPLARQPRQPRRSPPPSPGRGALTDLARVVASGGDAWGLAVPGSSPAPAPACAPPARSPRGGGDSGAERGPREAGRERGEPRGRGRPKGALALEPGVGTRVETEAGGLQARRSLAAKGLASRGLEAATQGSEPWGRARRWRGAR